MSTSSRQQQKAGYELRFLSLFDAGRALAFPCDASGSVEWHLLSERARLNYLQARKVIGKDWATPLVRRLVEHV